MLMAASVTLRRLVNGGVDNTWPGFVARSILDSDASDVNQNDIRMGPFMAYLENETL